MEDSNDQTPSIALKAAQNIESKTTSGEYTHLFVSIRLKRESLDSVVAYANMIGIEPDRLFEKVLHSGIKTLRGSLNGLPHTSIPKIIKRYGVQAAEYPDTPHDESLGSDLNDQ